MTIHFIGICGTAMATLAALLKQKGHDVQGSDENVYPPMSTFLDSENIRTLSGYRAEHITSQIGMVVVGNAISPRQRRARNGARKKDAVLLAA